MNKNELKKFVEDNPKLVSMRSAGDGIYVLKYSKRVFYDDLWSDELEYCRGTIVDADFNIVSYPFQKIYNYGIESRAPSFDKADMMTAFRKVNGFMVAMTIHHGELLVSTTGSTDSDYVDYAKEMMATHMPLVDWQMALMADDCRGMTFMFECVHPTDPHIIPEKPGMYLLGARENSWDSKIIRDPFFLQEFARDTLHCYWAESLTTNMERLEQLAKECKHEGFVFYHTDGRAAKIKSPYYLTSKWVARNPRTDKLMREDFKKQIDEEYYPLLAAIQSDIEAYTAKSEQERLEWVREFVSA
jgi:hypothetical protein